MILKREDDYLVTSESVTEGHPDKVCDQISDAILDAYLAQDPKSRVAVETMVSTDMVVLAGEVTSRGTVDVVKTAREVIRDIGYTEKGKGFDADTCMIFTNLHNQSPDISMGVGKGTEGEKEVLGGGDQGIMYGYASDETESLMPLPCSLANRLTMQLAAIRKQGKADFLYPDGKSQVTMRYRADGTPVSIESIVISAQHHEIVPKSVLEAVIRCLVIEPVIDKRWLTEETRIHINPTGRFVIGGPAGDTGLTGRKIMVDTYGTIGKHGGGAFSGKDPTKVDRSAAYAARYVAKNIVAAGLADKCEIQLSYAIGVAHPTSIHVETFGTGKLSDTKLVEIIRENFDLRPAGIIKMLDLRRPIYRQTAAYGHFGRTDVDLPWEHLDKVDDLKKYLA